MNRVTGHIPNAPTWDGPLADSAALLRMLDPLGVARQGSIERQRRLLADIFRLIGDRLIEKPHRAVAVIPAPPVETTTPARLDGSPSLNESLSPRLQQTLRCLLAGQSEKQAALELGLSPHTVHVYVKTLYRRFGVSTRAELLARHVRR